MGSQQIVEIDRLTQVVQCDSGPRAADATAKEAELSAEIARLSNEKQAAEDLAAQVQESLRTAATSSQERMAKAMSAYRVRGATIDDFRVQLTEANKRAELAEAALAKETLAVQAAVSEGVRRLELAQATLTSGTQNWQVLFDELRQEKEEVEQELEELQDYAQNLADGTRTFAIGGTPNSGRELADQYDANWNSLQDQSAEDRAQQLFNERLGSRIQALANAASGPRAALGDGGDSGPEERLLEAERAARGPGVADGAGDSSGLRAAEAVEDGTSGPRAAEPATGAGGPRAASDSRSKKKSDDDDDSDDEVRVKRTEADSPNRCHRWPILRSGVTLYATRLPGGRSSEYVCWVRKVEDPDVTYEMLAEPGKQFFSIDSKLAKALRAVIEKSGETTLISKMESLETEAVETNSRTLTGRQLMWLVLDHRRTSLATGRPDMLGNSHPCSAGGDWAQFCSR